MGSYPVVWQVAQSGEPVVAGRLEIGRRSLTLHGGHRGSERRLEIPFADISCVRGDYAWLGPLRAIAVDAPDVGSLILATTAGLMIRFEILEQLQLAATAAG